MRRKKYFQIVSGILAIVVMTLILSSSAWAQAKYKTIFYFNGTDGAYSWGPLTFDAAGNIYGVTQYGGDYGYGTTYELSPNADGIWTHVVLHTFTPDEDVWPTMGVIFDTSGNLYGVTNNGPDQGDVYQLVPQAGGGWSENVLHRFCCPYDGNPEGGLVFDASGNLYGTGGWGCGYGWGASCVFEMTPGSEGWTFSELYQFSFEGSTGWYPAGTTPIFDSQGNLYATTAFGGNSGCSSYGGCYGLGVVFELSPSGSGMWNINDLHMFTGGEDGESPVCALVFDAAGNLYGTTFGGGAYGNGNVFKGTRNPDGSWTGQVLHEFTGGEDGGAPGAGVVFDAAGNLYGTTTKGGAYGYGVVFRLTPQPDGRWHEAVLHAFKDTRADPGAYPWGSVIFDAAGNLYGATTGDGTNTFGTVYEISPQ